jgi:chromosome partitioning protein
MIIAIGATKGGVGKTTLAIQVAISLARSGRRVWLIDGDRQASAINAITARSEAGVSPGLAAGHFPDGKTLRAQVLQQQGMFDDIVIDVGGRDSTSLRAALVLADAIVVPFKPRSFEVWALDDTAELIEEARSQRDGLAAYALLNEADPAVLSTDNAEAEQAVRSIPTFEYLQAPIRRRKALSSASASGLHVDELPTRSRDAKASAEIARLVALLTKAQAPA